MHNHGLVNYVESAVNLIYSSVCVLRLDHHHACLSKTPRQVYDIMLDTPFRRYFHKLTITQTAPLKKNTVWPCCVCVFFLTQRKRRNDKLANCVARYKVARVESFEAVLVVSGQSLQVLFGPWKKRHVSDQLPSYLATMLNTTTRQHHRGLRLSSFPDVRAR